MDQRDLAEFIDRIVRESKIPYAHAREELRRELESHFADAGGTPDALRAAVERFGRPADVSGALERTHRRSRFLTNLLRIVTAVATAWMVAVAIQLLANLRVDAHRNIIGLGHGFGRSVAFATMIVVALVAAWELDIESFCGRLEKHPWCRLAAPARSGKLGHDALWMVQAKTGGVEMDSFLAEELEDALVNRVQPVD